MNRAMREHYHRTVWDDMPECGRCALRRALPEWPSILRELHTAAGLGPDRAALAKPDHNNQKKT